MSDGMGEPMLCMPNKERLLCEGEVLQMFIMQPGFPATCCLDVGLQQRVPNAAEHGKDHPVFGM